jgi:hypothetical protein
MVSFKKWAKRVDILTDDAGLAVQIEPGSGVTTRPPTTATPPMPTTPFLSDSALLRTLPRFFSYLLPALDASIDVARLLALFPGFASGLIIHHDDLPVPSFCTRTNRLCSDRLCLIEFWKIKK